MTRTIFDNVFICNHPVCAHNLAVIRDKNTNAEVFRSAVKRIAYLLFYMATEDLELETKKIETPVAESEEKILSRETQLILAPILRAGLIFSAIATEILPFATVRHIGMYRSEKDLKPVWYYNKIPVEIDKPQKYKILLLDPMLATGNTAVDATKMFVSKGIPEENIKFVSLISAPEGIQNLSEHFPKVKIYTAHVDEKLNNHGYIVPGLGDAGDRIFNTLEN